MFENRANRCEEGFKTGQIMPTYKRKGSIKIRKTLGGMPFDSGRQDNIEMSTILTMLVPQWLSICRYEFKSNSNQTEMVG